MKLINLKTTNRTFLIFSALICMKAYSINLTSTDMIQNQSLHKEQVANTFGCHGGNLSPELSWNNAPKTTKSFAITAYDPDAPMPGGFWHWVIYDIPTKTSSIQKGVSNSLNIPHGSIEGFNSAKLHGYVGACPPHGQHRYIFTIYALDITTLPVNQQASPTAIVAALKQHTLDKDILTAHYTKDSNHF